MALLSARMTRYVTVHVVCLLSGYCLLVFFGGGEKENLMPLPSFRQGFPWIPIIIYSALKATHSNER